MGVALGVATVIGMADVSATVLASFRQMVATIAGESELEVTSPLGRVDEALVARVSEVAGVRAAAGMVEAFLPLADRPAESLYLLGVDFLGSSVWETQFPRDAIGIDDELAFLARPDSVVLTSEFIERAHLDAGKALAILTPGGRRELRVRGVMETVAAARLFDGAIGVMDLPAAQRLLDRGTHVDRIAVQILPDTDVDEVRRRIVAVLGADVVVASPENRGRQVDSLLFSLRAMLATMSSTAVIVGILIVFHTVAASVRQRRRQFALLNVAGVSPRALVRLCLVETLVLAVVGAAFGVGGGVLLGRLGTGIVGSAVSGIWVRVDVGHPAHSLAGAVIGVLTGIATALAAAAFATRATFSATTVEALRPATFVWRAPATVIRSIVVPVLLLVGSWLILLAPPGLGFVGLVSLVIASGGAAYLGGALLAPTLVSAAGKAARGLLGRTSWLPARLAAGNLARDPTAGGATVGTIIVAMAIAVNVAGTVESFNRAWVGWVEEHFAADLFVGAGGRVQLLGGDVMPASLAADIRAVPGVAAVEPFRVRRISLADRAVFLQGIALAERMAHGGLPMVEGDLAAARPALEAGRGVLLSDNLAFRLGRHRGDTVELVTAGGPRTFRVEGTFTDYLGSLDLGSVAVAFSQLEPGWGDRDVNLFRVWLAAGASVSDVRATVVSRLGADTGRYVLTARQFLDGVHELVRGFFLATWAMQVIAALVGVIGIVNAQLASVVDRGPEISMLRTIGVPRRVVTGSVCVECGILGFLGGVGGVVVGVMVGMQIVTIVLRLVTGWQIPFAVATGPVVSGLLLAATISALAGYVPARAAAALEAKQQSID
jgi:putative ABC transport system permease protein